MSNALDGLTTAALKPGAMRESAQRTLERLDLIDRMDHRDPRTGGEITDTYHMAMETAVGTGELQRAHSVAELVARNEVGRTSRSSRPAAWSYRSLHGRVRCGTCGGRRARRVGRAGRPVARWMGPAAWATALVYGLRGDTEQFADWAVRGRPSRSTSTVPVTSSRLGWRCTRVTWMTPPRHSRDADGVRDFFDPYTVSLRAEVAVVVGAPDTSELVARASGRRGERLGVGMCRPSLGAASRATTNVAP